ncbi:MAG: right-handed parallel beta-helix repeat-containing protein [Phycisphaeraceae bacterium]|nr:right-handed parallel beta-helix repeat-containing protein [Phycisphaeraceae bacterium]
MIRPALISLTLASAAAFAGPIDPPAGPVAPTMKTLAEVEPRIAINAQNTPGDANSLYRISQPGSYYLTGNITGQPGMHGIEIGASDVTLDLNGFRLQGVPGSLDGIATGFLLFRVTIRNGTITSWGGDGIDLTEGGALMRPSLIEGIHATANSGRGISVGRYATIRDCTAANNVGDGIVAVRYAIVESSVSSDNGGAGFDLGQDSLATNCIANGNDSYGITGFAHLVVRDCVTEGNGLDGIRGPEGSNISGSASRNNGGNGIILFNGSTVRGCTAEGNTFAGIYASTRCLVIENNAMNNQAAGFRVFNIDSRVEGNNSTGNTVGYLVESAGNFIARNTASGNTSSNWSVVAGNACFVVNATNSAAINGNSGGVSPGSTNPNANYTY